jgi:hypothetical protein
MALITNPIKLPKTQTDHNKNNELDKSDESDSLIYSTTTDSGHKILGPRPSSTYGRTRKLDAEITEERKHQQNKSQHQQIHNKTTKDQKNLYQIKMKSMHSNNLPFGDDIMEDTNEDTILFHNINGIKEETNWHQISKTMAELNVSIFGFAEINQTLRQGAQHKWVQVTRKFFSHSKMIHSESDITMDGYKPGGTITTITGKWQARVSEKGTDESGLGRWSYLKVSSNRKAIIIKTAYRPCASHGPSTAWMQQWTLLRESGETNPDPIKKFYNDLEKLIQGWIKQNIEIILLIDANETIGEKPGGLSSAVGRLGLVDLIRDRHFSDEHIHTYSRGSKQIDYILGTKMVQANCQRSGMLPFGIGYPSDHRALFVKVNLEQILKTTIKAIDTITARKLTQATPRERKIFLEEVDKHFNNQNLYQRTSPNTRNVTNR